MYNPTININWKKTIIALFILLLILSAGFAVYTIFFGPPTPEEIETMEREILDEKLQQDKTELEKAREASRGDDYVPPTTEEREQSIEDQVKTLEGLRNR
jgi:regulatory protein YycI of two-component signal transduction system YycFG